MATARLAGEPVRVVVADDDEETRAVLVRLLDGVAEVEVVGAAPRLSVAEALVAEQQPDVVLLDRVMPGVEGPEAVEALRKQAPAVAIVVVSGYGRDDREARALADAADGYVEKGAPRATLVGVILRSAARGPRLSAIDEGEPTSGRSAPEESPTLAGLADGLHDGPVQSLSGALWTLDALQGAEDEVRREQLMEHLRTTLRASLASTRRLMRWAREGDDGAGPSR